LPHLFLHLGGKNLLPLTYVDNCAEAIAHVGQLENAWGQKFNVVDDEVVTSADYLAAYEQAVRLGPSLRVPYPFLLALSRFVEWYHHYSEGQLPPVFTPYKSKTTWKGCRFSNAKLRATGWQPCVSTAEGMRRTMADLRSRRPAH
jgi:nucleoside-diphosphate-sugar epimerase